MSPRRLALSYTICASAVLAAVALPRAARAEDRVPVRVDYRATPGCPDEASFLSRIRARTERFERSYAPDASRSLVVEVTRPGPHFEGEMIWTDSGVHTSRRVTGETCDDVVEALTLVTALAIDPEASLVPPPPRAAPTPPPPRSNAPLPMDRAARVAREEPPWRIAAGAGVSVSQGAGPSLFVGAPIFVEVSRVAEPGFRLAPALRLAFEHPLPNEIAANGGSARFSWTVGTLDVCPVRWASTKLRVSLCARIEAGALRGAGVNVASAEGQTRAWFALGLLARGRWMLASPLFLEADVGVMIPLVRELFYFGPAPGFLVYDVPMAGIRGTLGLGVSF